MGPLILWDQNSRSRLSLLRSTSAATVRALFGDGNTLSFGTANAGVWKREIER